jgi:hypothetical protein
MGVCTSGYSIMAIEGEYRYARAFHQHNTRTSGGPTPGSTDIAFRHGIGPGAWLRASSIWTGNGSHERCRGSSRREATKFHAWVSIS